MTVCVFTMMVLMNWTATAQSDSTNTCTGIHYTIEMDRAAQECWENDAERRAKFQECQQTQTYLLEQYRQINGQLAAATEQNTRLTNANIELKRAVKRNRWGWIGTALAAAGGIFITIAVK